MARKIPIILALFIASCSGIAKGAPDSTGEFPLRATSVNATAATGSVQCISSQPSQQDINRISNYFGDMLDLNEWNHSMEIREGSITITFQNITRAAVIFVEGLIFPCGYDSAGLDRYFGGEHWDTLFQNYDSHVLVDDCTSGTRLRLYLFRASSQGFEYNIRHWVQSDTKTRVITTMLVFPVGSETTLGNYSRRFFPDLPNCQ